MKIIAGLSAALAALITLAGPVRASAPTPGKQHGEHLKKRIVQVVESDYLLYLPKDYGKDRTQKWPLILFLHGSGERGTDVQKVATHGPPKLVAAGQDFPFIIVSPQCPDNDWWNNDVLTGLLDEIETKYSVDKDREYLTGLSMGGFGTWALAIAQPTRFAAIAPICGGGDARRVRRLKDVPVWVFHGAKDPTVNIKEDQAMVDALESAGGNVKFTVYPEAGHDSWTETYSNPDLYTWFLAHKRPATAPAAN